MEAERWTDNVLTQVHPVNDRLHRTLWGVTLQNKTFSLASRLINLFIFLLGGGNLKGGKTEKRS